METTVVCWGSIGLYGDIVPLKSIFGYITRRTPYTPKSIYLRGTILLWKLMPDHALLCILSQGERLQG